MIQEQGTGTNLIRVSGELATLLGRGAARVQGGGYPSSSSSSLLLSSLELSDTKVYEP